MQATIDQQQDHDMSFDNLNIVHIVDGNKRHRSVVHQVLASAGYAVQTYESEAQFLSTKVELRTGCIVVDLQMPTRTGLEFQNLLKQNDSILPLIFISGTDDISIAVAAMKAGAEDFLKKPIKQDYLLKTVCAAMARYHLARQFKAQKLLHNAKLASLTKRENEVLQILLAGKTNKQIAAALGNTERTVKAHRKQIMDKMECFSVVQLAAAMTTYMNPIVLPH